MERKGEENKVLDLRGVSCPWSILKAKSELIVMEPGEILEVLTNDPIMFEDFPKIIGQSEHQLIDTNQQAGFARICVKRGKREEISDGAGSQAGVAENLTKRR